MLDFQKYVARYGEVCVQDIVERIERYEGRRPAAAVSLEERWAAVMQAAPEPRAALPLAA